MATKTITYCDITKQPCKRRYKIGISDGDEEYLIDLSEKGVLLLMAELVNQVPSETMDTILQDLIGPRWREVLVKL